MKYVIYKRKNLFLPLVFPDCVAHSQFKPDDTETKLFSAGFCSLHLCNVTIDMTKQSESLGIGPSDKDEDILTAWFLNSGTVSFIDWDSI
jgi:hypothetical protein